MDTMPPAELAHPLRYVPKSGPRRPLALLAMDASFRRRTYTPEALDRLGRLVDWRAEPIEPAELRANPGLLADVEVLFSGWGAPAFDEAFFDAAPRLRAIFYAGGSIRYLVPPSLWDRGVLISSAYGMNALPVACFALGAIMLGLKHAWYYARSAHVDGRFPPRRPMPGTYRSTVGLVSLSQTGLRVAELLADHDLRVLAYDPLWSHERMRNLGVTPASLEEIFATSDVVSLHLPLLPETRGLITGALLASLPSGATLVNTARGQVVDETALIEVLAARPDITAILDVTAEEPPPPGSPLYSLPNVMLTPHIAGSLDGECARMGDCMVQEFERWLAGEPLLWSISREQFKIIA
jgi:phosphoglycerate dehydrogenase-like enzyme